MNVSVRTSPCVPDGSRDRCPTCRGRCGVLEELERVDAALLVGPGGDHQRGADEPRPPSGNRGLPRLTRTRCVGAHRQPHTGTVIVTASATTVPGRRWKSGSGGAGMVSESHLGRVGHDVDLEPCPSSALNGSEYDLILLAAARADEDHCGTCPRGAMRNEHGFMPNTVPLHRACRPALCASGCEGALGLIHQGLEGRRLGSPPGRRASCG